MALGRPVIASALGGPTEYVDDGVTGLLHAPGDAEDLARAVVRTLTDREAALRMAAAGRATSRRRFGAATPVERTFRAYERLVRSEADGPFRTAPASRL
jgi:glycosyltransferase involved in cell wall biosynthesis